MITIAASRSVTAQTVQEVLSPKQMTVTWLGVDFTHIKVQTGSDAFLKYMPDHVLRVNQAVATDHSRYYFPIAYKKDFQYKTEYIDSLNKTLVNIQAEGKRDAEHLTPEAIKEIVDGYHFPSSLHGIGLVYVYDCLIQRGKDWGKVWMVYLNIDTKEILFLQNDTINLTGNSIEVQMAYPVLGMLREVKAHLDGWDRAPEKYTLLKTNVK